MKNPFKKYGHFNQGYFDKIKINRDDVIEALLRFPNGKEKRVLMGGKIAEYFFDILEIIK